MHVIKTVWKVCCIINKVGISAQKEEHKKDVSRIDAVHKGNISYIIKKNGYALMLVTLQAL